MAWCYQLNNDHLPCFSGSVGKNRDKLDFFDGAKGCSLLPYRFSNVFNRFSLANLKSLLLTFTLFLMISSLL
jgi:hypothetical protein